MNGGGDLSAPENSFAVAAEQEVARAEQSETVVGVERASVQPAELFGRAERAADSSVTVESDQVAAKGHDRLPQPCLLTMLDVATSWRELDGRISDKPLALLRKRRRRSCCRRREQRAQRS